MQFQQLLYVLEAAKTGSFSNAAKNLYVSQPSLSQQIISLEKELGISLFIRHSRSVSLTDAGRQFVVSAARIVNEYEQVSSLMNDYSFQKTGTIRIGLLWVADYLGIINILKNYQDFHKGIRYKVHINGSLQLLKEVEEHIIDAAFVVGEEETMAPRKDLYTQLVMRDCYMAVVSKDNPLSEREVIRFSDLNDQTVIMPLPNSSLSKRLEHHFSIHQVKPHILCESNQTNMNLSFARSNMAIFFCSNHFSNDLIDESVRLVPLEENMSRSIYFVTLKEMQNYPLIHSFSNFVRHNASRTLHK